MFAVVRTGGKQYRVSADDRLVVERLAGEPGDTVTLETLMIGDDGKVRAAETGVTAEILAHDKADKVIIFKKKRRHNYRRKRGHRQQQTHLRILTVG